MRLIILAAATVISGCAQMGTMYSACDQQHDRFADVSACTKAAIKADSRYSFHNGYISNANRAMAAMDMLEEKVTSGSMTDKEARYQMHELMAQMQAQIAAQVNAINSATQSQQTKPIRTNCQIDSYTNTARCVSR